MSAFERAFQRTLGHEGGYSNDPHDTGKETKYGISKRAYPQVDIWSLTLEQARSIYHRDYWMPISGDALPVPVAAQVFDAAVNHGVRQAIVLMQRALGVRDDGVIGPVTLAAAGITSVSRFTARFQAERLSLYTVLPTWATFGRGWARRVVDQLRQA